MNFLLCSILCSVAVAVFLKLARQRKIDVAQAVAVNYVVAVAWTMALLLPNNAVDGAVLWNNAWLFGALGVILPVGFLVMARAVAYAGIVKSDVAQRLSLFLPVLMAFTVFGEAVKWQSIVGLLLAFSALACVLYKPQKLASENQSLNAHAKQKAWAVLLGVWLTYGTVDVLFKQLSKMGAKTTSVNLLVAFSLAGIIMFAYLCVKKTKWDKISLLSGLLLGSLNFGNILFYIKAHMAFAQSPTTVFAGMNMGVIALGTLVGAVGFKEKISSVNMIGVALAILAVVVLYYGAQLM